VSDYSKSALLAFLREAAVSGHMSPAAARSRRNAAERLFEQLTEPEAADLRQVDVAVLASRAREQDSDRLRPEVVELYAGRLRAALDDFFRFREAPDRFLAAKRSAQGGAQVERGAPRSEEERALEQLRLASTHYRPDILPIALAPDRVVYLHQLPTDLSTAEAQRIARVVMALAIDAQDGTLPEAGVAPASTVASPGLASGAGDVEGGPEDAGS